MAQSDCATPLDSGRTFNEAVCIDTKRIYDSCVDKDCLEDLRVTFTQADQAIINSAISIKCRECEISTCTIDVDEVPFNHGFYSVDITFFFVLTFDVYSAPATVPNTIVGFAVFSKKCILYGSDGNVKIFTSTYAQDDLENQTTPQYSNPIAKVQCVDPIVLSTRVCDACQCCCDPCCCAVPRAVTDRIGCCDFAADPCDRAVLVTLGLFTIIQMERDVQMLIPAYDYCIPEKECSCNTDNPCDAFKRIQFPIDEFFPPERENSNGQCGCCDDK